MPRALRVQRRVVDNGAGFLVRAAAGKHRQLFFGARELAGETQQLEQERTRSRIVRVITELSRERLTGFAHLPCFEQFSWICWHRLPTCLSSYHGFSFNTSKPLSMKPCSAPSFSGL